MVIDRIMNVYSNKPLRPFDYFAFSALIVLFVTPYYLNFDPLILDHPLTSTEIPLTAKIFLVSYTVFFLFILVCPLVSLGLFFLTRFRKLKTFLCGYLPLAGNRAYRRIAKISLVLIAAAAGLSAWGFYRENRRPPQEEVALASETSRDINVILIVIDALRADHLGCYGYERETSPRLDELAGEGVIFKHCYSQSSWTKPSVASILTSLYPSRHGTTLHGQALPENVVTIAEVMSEQGFLTYGFVTNPNLKKIFNFDQGFDFFDDRLLEDKFYYGVLRQLGQKPPYFLRLFTNRFNTHVRDNARLANNFIIPWLREYQDQNFFMYLHYMDPHRPFIPPAPYNKMFPYVRGDKDSRMLSLYDGEIRFVDTEIGNLIDELKALRLFAKTLLIITSDHGQAFGEHGDYGHGRTIYQNQLQVPLLGRGPGNFSGGRQIAAPVKVLDLVPTILDFLDIESDVDWEGSSLLPLIENEKSEETGKPIFLEENLDGNYILSGVIKNNEWKHILTEKSALRDVTKEGREELYNLVQDPQESNNLVDREPEMLETMRNYLIGFKNRLPAQERNPSQVKIDPETIRQLRALGYLQ